MKAVVVNEIGGGFQVEDIIIDDPVGEEVLVEVKAAGLCRTDLSVASHRHDFPMPAVLGHELAGIVTKVGPEVTGFEIGDHVVGTLIQFCGHCANCLSDRSYQCLDRDATLRNSEQRSRLSRDGTNVAQGFGLGAFAQQVLAHSNQLVKIAREMPFPQAALLGCGGLTGMGAVLNTARVRPGESVVIVGAGGVGLNGVNGAVIAGASPIIAIDVAAEKLEKAREFGATHTINSAEEDPVAAVRRITGGGADYVFDFVGIGKVQEQGIAMLGKGGGLYLIGVTAGQNMNVDGRALLQGQNSIRGVHMGSGVLRRDVPAYVDLYLAGKLKLDGMISKEIGLDEVEAGYEMLKDPTVTRVVVTSF